MRIEKDVRVGELAAEYPLATRILERHGIDFCCGGGRKLEEACAARGVDTSQVIDEIAGELAGSTDDERAWDQAPLEDLIQHIVLTYHRSLDEELPQLEAMARKVWEVHGEKDPRRLSELLSVFQGLQAELQSHMAKEETVLFPMIQRGLGRQAGSPIMVMEHEHDSAGAALRRLRELTDGYQAPEAACTTWRALYNRLENLERELHQHIHLENNILFPRALDS